MVETITQGDVCRHRGWYGSCEAEQEGFDASAAVPLTDLLGSGYICGLVIGGKKPDECRCTPLDVQPLSDQSI